jgi:hypothetical protein
MSVDVEDRLAAQGGVEHGVRRLVDVVPGASPAGVDREELASNSPTSVAGTSLTSPPMRNDVSDFAGPMVA